MEWSQFTKKKAVAVPQTQTEQSPSLEQETPREALPISQLPFDGETPQPTITDKVVEDEANAPIVRADETAEVNFGQVLEQIASGSSEETAISGIMKLSTVNDPDKPDKDLAYKSVVKNPRAFSAAQFFADLNDLWGMSDCAVALRNLCSWQYSHETAGRGGERAKQAFAALNEQQQKEFLLTKEAKGLIR